MAFDQGEPDWMLGFTIGAGQTPRRRPARAGNVTALDQEIAQAKRGFSLSPKDCGVCVAEQFRCCKGATPRQIVRSTRSTNAVFSARLAPRSF